MFGFLHYGYGDAHAITDMRDKIKGVNIGAFGGDGVDCAAQ
jgi:hypothetical protein